MHLTDVGVCITAYTAGLNPENLNLKLSIETELCKETLQWDSEELWRMSASMFSRSAFMSHTLIFMLHFLWVARSVYAFCDSAHLQGGPIWNLFRNKPASVWSEIFAYTFEMVYQCNNYGKQRNYFEKFNFERAVQNIPISPRLVFQILAKGL